MLAKLARNYYGEKEVAGKASNPVIQKIIDENYSLGFEDSNVAWCGIFMKHLCRKANLPFPENFAMARNWLKVGEPIDFNNANENDVVVLWRKKKDSIYGHVALYFRHTKTHVFLMGGNQGNSVSIKAYPISRVLGIRRLVAPEKEIIKEVVVEKPIEVEKVVYKYPIIDFLKKLFKRKKHEVNRKDIN